MAEINSSKDACFIKSLLHDAGIINYDPIVVDKLLCISNVFANKVLQDAVAYSHHAQKKTVDKSDVILAINASNEKLMLSKEEMVELAQSKNAASLPEISAHNGLRLPPERYCLTSKNYKLHRKKAEPIEIRLPKQTIPYQIISSSVPMLTPVNINPQPQMMTKKQSKVSADPQKLVFRPKFTIKSGITENKDERKRKRDTDSSL